MKLPRRFAAAPAQALSRGRRGCCLSIGAALLQLPALSRGHDVLPDVIGRIKPSVLAVGVFKETSTPRFSFRGTGFVVGNGSLVVTNAHVVDRSADNTADGNLVVGVRDDHGQLTMRRVEVIELDKVHDLAVLRFDGAPLPALELAKPSAAREGQRVAFTGYPLGGALGFSPVTHRGTISSLTTVALPSPSAQQLDAKAISRIREGSFEMIQLDATAYPGNSGGPLFDADTGLVLGVVNMVTLKGARESALTHPSGISYAVPVVFIIRLLEQAPHK